MCVLKAQITEKNSCAPGHGPGQIPVCRRGLGLSRVTPESDDAYTAIENGARQMPNYCTYVQRPAAAPLPPHPAMPLPLEEPAR
jgi:hypothetical protein